MELPIPTHLKTYMIPIGDSNSEYEVTGMIRCTCESEEFEVFESNDRHIVKLICKKCGKELLLFDAGKHGWNGYVCNMEDYIDRKLPFIKYCCSKCDGDAFHVTVWIGSQGKQDFIDECVFYEDSFLPENWIDGFEWIAVSLSCEQCGEVEENWINLETM